MTVASYEMSAAEGSVGPSLESWHGHAKNAILHQRQNGLAHKNRVDLDPNHSHFLLVDDGTEGTFGGEPAR